MGIILQVVKWVLVAYAIYSVGKSSFKEASWSFTKQIVRNFTFLMFIKVVTGLAITISTIVLLYNHIPFLQWSWTKMVFGESINIVAAPINTGNQTVTYIVGIPFLLLLLAAIPRFAYAEEKTFRRLTVNHKNILWKSVLFGLVHCIVGIPLAAGLGLAIGGLVFGYAYRAKFLALLKAQKMMHVNDRHYRSMPGEQFINERAAMSTIQRCNEEALKYSTSYHTMWNWILVTITLVGLLTNQ